MDFFSEEEKKKKSLYVYMTSVPDDDLKLLRISPHLEIQGKSNGFEDMTDVVFNNSTPPDFNAIRVPRLAAIEPKLYFIGGAYKNNSPLYRQVVSKQVFAFDTTTNRWDSSTTAMNVERLFPTVLTYKRKIYAFGYQFLQVLRPQDREDQSEQSDYPDYYDDPGKQWVECYDPEKDEWNLISTLPPPELAQHQSTIIHAVFEEKQLVLFCSQGCNIHGYKFEDSSWFSISTDSFDEHVLNWSNQVVVLRSYVFWHHYGTIYAHKFVEDNTDTEPFGLFTLDSAWDTFGSSENLIDPVPPPPSFLVDAGNGLLCIVYQCPRSVHQNELRCNILKLRLSPSQQNPFIHNPNYCQTHQAKKEIISTVLAM